MDYTITLVAANKDLSAGHIACLEHFAEDNGLLRTGQPEWLDKHIAATLPLSENLTLEQMHTLQDQLADDKIDIFCTRTKNRKKKLLLADMDSTIVTTETLDELADFVGLKDKVADITTRAMNGELDYKASLRERVRLLEGLSADKMQETLKQTKLSNGAKKLVKTMRSNHAASILVSSGFTYFTEAIASQCGFTNHHGNILGIKDGILDGNVKEPILDKDSKLAYLEEYKERLGLSYDDIVAIGDGANDLPMLQAAGLGIGFHPKPVLRQSILNCILHCDLTAALYAQGYKKITD